MLKIGYKILGTKYTVVFLILVFYKSFSIIFGILKYIFWYSTNSTPPPPPPYHPTPPALKLRILIGVS